MTELTTIVDGEVWATERTVWFSGVRLRARTSIMKLADDGLLIHSPAPLSEELKARIAQLGPVRWLVVPNCFHHLGTPAAAAAFPDAKVVGPPSAAAKNPALHLDLEICDPSFAAHVPELAVLPLAGVPFLDETLLYHRPTETLFGADAVLRADEHDHFTWRIASRMLGCYRRVRVPPDVKKEVANREAAAESLRALERLPVRRLVVAHGEVIDEDPVAKLLEAWKLVGVGT